MKRITKSDMLNMALEHEKNAYYFLGFDSMGEVDTHCSGFSEWISWAAYLQKAFGITVNSHENRVESWSVKDDSPRGICRI